MNDAKKRSINNFDLMYLFAIQTFLYNIMLILFIFLVMMNTTTKHKLDRPINRFIFHYICIVYVYSTSI